MPRRGWYGFSTSAWFDGSFARPMILSRSKDLRSRRGSCALSQAIRSSGPTEFLTEMAFLREGFAARARVVRDLMRSTSTKFILVSTADTVGMEAARSVAAELVGRDFRFSALVCNRSFIPELGAGGRGVTTYPARLAALAPKLERMRTLLADEEERKRGTWSHS